MNFCRSENNKYKHLLEEQINNINTNWNYNDKNEHNNNDNNEHNNNDNYEHNNKDNNNGHNNNDNNNENNNDDNNIMYVQKNGQHHQIIENYDNKNCWLPPYISIIPSTSCKTENVYCHTLVSVSHE